jgi:hypothetical protein
MDGVIIQEENPTKEQPDYNDITKFLNVDYGVIGRTVSTKVEPNTSSEFHFWVANRDVAQGKIEIGNILAAYSDSGNDITFGVVVSKHDISTQNRILESPLNEF